MPQRTIQNLVHAFVHYTVTNDEKYRIYLGIFGKEKWPLNLEFETIRQCEKARTEIGQSLAAMIKEVDSWSPVDVAMDIQIKKSVEARSQNGQNEVRGDQRVHQRSL